MLRSTFRSWPRLPPLVTAPSRAVFARSIALRADPARTGASTPVQLERAPAEKTRVFATSRAAREDEAAGLEAREEGEENDGNPPDKDGITPKIYRAAKRELDWVKSDRAALAQRAERCLEEDEELLALALVRMASKEKDKAVAAWNLLIKHRMRQSPPHYTVALKRFSEMRKRAQTPDSYTLGSLLDGFEKYANPTPAIVEKAFDVFQYGLKEDSPVRLNLEHYHMMVKVAGRISDHTVLWKVLETMPEFGPLTPTSTTYTLILKSLAQNGPDPDDIVAYRAHWDQALETGRTIWSAVVASWQEGTLRLDGRLLNAMIQLLNKGWHTTHWDQVFSLIEQTTGIKRHRPITSLVANDPRIHEYSCFTPPPKNSRATQIQPSNHILTSLMQVIENYRSRNAAQYYWDVITGPGGLAMKPDVQSLKAYLNVLRRSRSSNEAVKTVTEMQDTSLLDFGAYRVAMSTCKRNGWRPNTVREASQLYKHRKAVLGGRAPDMRVIDHFSTVIDVAENEELRLEALHVLGSDPYHVLREPSLGWFSRDVKNYQYEQLERDTAEVAKRLIGLYDHMVNEKLCSPSEFAHVKGQLAEFVRSFIEKHGSGDFDMLGEKKDRRRVDPRRGQYQQRRSVKNTLYQQDDLMNL